MATMDLLKASISGSLGQTTGAVSKGRNIIKSKIWSKRPGNEAQTGAVRSFESVNRLAGAIAREAFPLTGLDAKNLLKHNAIARFLKPMLKNKVFEPENMADVMPISNRLLLLPDNNQPTDETFVYNIALEPNAIISPDERLIFFVFNEVGVVHFINTYTVENTTVNVPLHTIPRENIMAMAFISSTRGNKRYLSECLFENHGEWRSTAQTQLTWSPQAPTGGYFIFPTNFAQEIYGERATTTQNMSLNPGKYRLHVKTFIANLQGMNFTSLVIRSNNGLGTTRRFDLFQNAGTSVNFTGDEFIEFEILGRISTNLSIDMNYTGTYTVQTTANLQISLELFVPKYMWLQSFSFISNSSGLSETTFHFPMNTSTIGSYFPCSLYTNLFLQLTNQGRYKLTFNNFSFTKNVDRQFNLRMSLYSENSLIDRGDIVDNVLIDDFPYYFEHEFDTTGIVNANIRAYFSSIGQSAAGETARYQNVWCSMLIET